MKALSFAAVFSSSRTLRGMLHFIDHCGALCLRRSISARWNCRAAPHALTSPRSRSMNALMERLHHALQPLMAVPFGFFGHSVGAGMAYEAARRLRSIDGRTPRICSFPAAQAPMCFADPPPARQRSDDDLLAVLERFGGTPAEIMQRPELMVALLPALRADLALAEGLYSRPGSASIVRSPYLAARTTAAHSGSLQTWRDFTNGDFRSCIFPGGHFYLVCGGGFLPRRSRATCRRSMGMHASSARS